MDRLIVFTVIFIGFISCKKDFHSHIVLENKEYSLTYEDIKKCHALHDSLPPAKAGEWLDAHKENGQTFEEYIESKPVKAVDGRNKIYFRLIGDFDKVDRLVFSKMKEYVSLFYQLPVVVYAEESDNFIPKKYRRPDYFDSEQLKTTFFLDEFLPKQLPDDAITLMALTAKDLYPQDSWNFVFGQAKLKKRVGVSSIFRLKNEDTTLENNSVFLERVLKIITHETGHMFSIKHCKDEFCLMNGSNNMEETDGKPVWFCSECLAKISWNLNWDLLKRNEELTEFFQKNNFPERAAYYVELNGILKGE